MVSSDVNQAAGQNWQENEYVVELAYEGSRWVVGFRPINNENRRAVRYVELPGHWEPHRVYLKLKEHHINNGEKMVNCQSLLQNARDAYSAWDNKLDKDLAEAKEQAQGKVVCIN